MTELLLKLFIDKNADFEDKNTRIKVGFLAGVVGVIINIFLSILKLSIGLLISSISVIADGVNNMADSASSLVTLVGFKLSGMPADKEHPYGHGRIEYISALIVAFMVILVGFQFIKASFDRIINPVPVEFQLLPFIALVVSILFKLWLIVFNRNLGKKINSTGLKATATDATGDVLITSVVVISIFVSRYTTLPVDGFIGLLVSLFIMYSGYSLVKETISPLIGEAPDPELIESIYKDILKYDYITGAHDLFLHNYGAGRTMATIDVEFPADIDVVTIHDVIDQAERELGEKYNLHLVIHMDPLWPESNERFELRNSIKSIIKKNKRVESIHDFHMTEDGEKKLIELHVVIDPSGMKTEEDYAHFKKELEQSVMNEVEGVEINLILDLHLTEGEENNVL